MMLSILLNEKDELAHTSNARIYLKDVKEPAYFFDLELSKTS